MLKIIFALLISQVHANIFSLNQTSSRFRLLITKSQLTYESEKIQKKIQVTKCNLKMVKKLNGEIMREIPHRPLNHGLNFQFDDKNILIDPKSNLGQKILGMDMRMTTFFIMEKEKCQK